jgi:hypothetical protein
VADKPEFNGWEHAKQAATFARVNVGAAVKACALWLILITLATASVTPLAIWLVQNSTDFAAFVRSLGDDRMVGFLIGAPVILLTIAAWPSIAVAWHRFVLRHEQPPPLPLSLRGLLYFLLATGILIGVYIVPAVLLGGGLVLAKGQLNFVVVLVPLAIFVGLLGLAMRVTLKLPAIAVADSSMTLARSWRETETMWPGMLWGTVVLILPTYLASTVIHVIVGNVTEEGQTEILVVLSTINLIAIFVGVILYATFLSFSYQHAVGDTSSTFD